jgi:hypothetical protein
VDSTVRKPMCPKCGTPLVRRVTLEKGADGGSAEGNFANRCPHYGAMQEDYLLYSEPGDVFF